MSKFLYKHRRGTTEQWANKGNEIKPEEGEIVIEIDEKTYSHKLKIGDGIHTYSELAYLMAGDEIVSQVLPRIVTVTLDVNKWAPVEGKPYYAQPVDIGEITAHSRLDLQPNADMLAEFQSLNLVFVTENNGEAITVYSVGDKPLKTYPMQATIVETAADVETVVGTPIGTPTTNPDWNQNDETKADYIKNKPNIEGLSYRVTNLEKAALGNIYEMVEETDVKYTTQLLTDTLPYGIISRVGGLPTQWTGDNEASYSGGSSFNPGDLPEGDEEFIIISEASEVQIQDYNDYTDDNGDNYSIVTHYTIPTNQKVRLSEATIYCEDTRDGSTWESTYGGYWGVSQTCSCTSSFKIIYGNLSLVSNPVKRVEIGLPYTLVGARVYRGAKCRVTENSVILPAGSRYGVQIPCKLPSGAKARVKASGENSAGEAIKKCCFMSSSGSSVSGTGWLNDTEITLTGDGESIVFYTNKSTSALTADLEISNFEVIVSNPDVATLYDAHTIEIPDDLMAYLNDNGYDYGIGIDETCYNYIDFTERKYYQYCKLENDVAIRLDAPVIVDVAEYLADNLDVVPCSYGYLVRFINKDNTTDPAPYSLCYKNKITNTD